MGERRGQLGLERGDELAAGGRGRVGRARATDEDDAGGESVSLVADATRFRSSVRIGQVPLMAKPARITASRKVSQPVLAVPAIAVALGLLKGVVDGDREGRVGLLGQAVHRLGHTMEKERFGSRPYRRGGRECDQLLGLRNGERGEEVGENNFQRPAQPDIEEVR